jgi:hypothetical protein
MGRRSLDLIDAMFSITEAAHPITGRGVGYKLFMAGLIPSMSRSDMQRVYRLLKIAREQGTIPWHWIVDETRDLERRPSWDDPEAFAEAASRQYRRDFWTQQPERCEVWSEKGTLRGVLAPVLDRYGVGFRVMHGFTSATFAYDIASDNDDRLLTALYVGDWDPSGLWMSECDLPDRLIKYGGNGTGCPLYPRKRTLIERVGMSALCQKQTFCAAVKNVVIRSPRRRGRIASAVLRCEAPSQY